MQPYEVMMGITNKINKIHNICRLIGHTYKKNYTNLTFKHFTTEISIINCNISILNF